MERLFKDSRTLLRMREGPLGDCIGLLASRLHHQGYMPDTARLWLRLVADFSRWLKGRGIAVDQITSDDAGRYLRCRARHHRRRPMDAVYLERFLDVLRDEKILAEKTVSVETGAVEQLAAKFALYLRQERALCDSTVAWHLYFAKQFLIDRFNGGAVCVAELCAMDVVGFVQRYAAHLKRMRAKQMTTALRSFLRYLHYCGDITVDLAACVPAVANWRMASVPRSLGAGQVQELLASCDRQTAMGRRDYAILLLLARLGLRAGEVAYLTLEDIDWESGRLSVRAKGGRQCRLPLPAEVGEAIAAYLQHGRPPQAGSRRVFLRERAPIDGFNSARAVSSIVKHALARAGIDSPHKGAHQLRHTLACQMLRQGASLPEIGEVLRHRNPQTTTIYAKVDLASLRPLSMPWPGGAK